MTPSPPTRCVQARNRIASAFSVVLQLLLLVVVLPQCNCSLSCMQLHHDYASRLCVFVVVPTHTRVHNRWWCSGETYSKRQTAWHACASHCVQPADPAHPTAALFICLHSCVCSKTYCPFCIKAKKALGQFLQPNQMEVIEVSGCLTVADVLTDRGLSGLAARTTGGQVACVPAIIQVYLPVYLRW